MTEKLAARLGNYWLVLTPRDAETWRLQLWGDLSLEAEVIASDEEAAKEAAVAAAISQLKERDPDFREPAEVTWSPAFTSASRLPPEPRG